jgi:hypothetical protein
MVFALLISALNLVPSGVTMGGCFVHFIFRLPRRVRNLTLLSALTYVGGALGCEMIGGLLRAAGAGPSSWQFRLEIVFEETLEMSGVSLWICTQLSYLRELQGAPT